MDAYSEMALGSLEWLTGKPYSVLVLLAALPLAWYVVQLRGLSVIAIGLLAGGFSLLKTGLDELVAAMALLSAGGLLIAVDVSLMRRRLARFENSLGSAVQSVRALEVAEERRQAFIARQQNPHPAVSEDRRAPSPEVTEANETAPQ
jgi:hypothetical protein